MANELEELAYLQRQKIKMGVAVYDVMANDEREANRRKFIADAEAKIGSKWKDIFQEAGFKTIPVNGKLRSFEVETYRKLTDHHPSLLELDAPPLLSEPEQDKIIELNKKKHATTTTANTAEGDTIDVDGQALMDYASALYRAKTAEETWDIEEKAVAFGFNRSQLRFMLELGRRFIVNFS